MYLNSNIIIIFGLSEGINNKNWEKIDEKELLKKYFLKINKNK